MRNFFVALFDLIFMLVAFPFLLFVIVTFFWGGTEILVRGSIATYQQFGPLPTVAFWFGILCIAAGFFYYRRIR